MLDVKDIESLDELETPFYFYDMDLLSRTLDTVGSLSGKYGLEIHYAVKANEDRRILENIASAGLGADCVSGNEVEHAIACGFDPSRIVFAGVGKTDREIVRALDAGIEAFNCESLHEIYVVNALAGRLGKRANVSVRINPNIDAHTHKYITTGLYENKFGIASHEFEALAGLLGECGSLDFTGLHFHVGSQITSVGEVFALECERVNGIVAYFESKGLKVDNIDLGGGLGVDYDDPDGNPIPDFSTWFATIDSRIDRSGGRRIHLEPGRSIVAQCGSLISRVLFLKSGETKTFLILDAGMNDLIRPALYGAYHKIENLSSMLRPELCETQVYEIVGPVCESSDVWGSSRILPISVRGDIIAIRSAGAYGQAMASAYNLRDMAGTVYSDRIGEGVKRADYFA